MNLQEQYKRLFKGRVATTDKKIIEEATNVHGNPEQFPKKWITKIKINSKIKQLGMGDSPELTKEKEGRDRHSGDVIHLPFPEKNDPNAPGTPEFQKELKSILTQMGMKEDRDYDAVRVWSSGRVEIWFNTGYYNKPKKGGINKEFRNNQDFIEVVQIIRDESSDGRNMTDDITDELGDFYDGVYDSNDTELIQVYDDLRGTIDGTPPEQAEAAQALLDIIG